MSNDFREEPQSDTQYNGRDPEQLEYWYGETHIPEWDDEPPPTTKDINVHRELLTKPSDFNDETKGRFDSRMRELLQP